MGAEGEPAQPPRPSRPVTGTAIPRIDDLSSLSWWNPRVFVADALLCAICYFAGVSVVAYLGVSWFGGSGSCSQTNAAPPSGLAPEQSDSRKSDRRRPRIAGWIWATLTAMALAFSALACFCGGLFAGYVTCAISAAIVARRGHARAALFLVPMVLWGVYLCWVEPVVSRSQHGCDLFVSMCVAFLCNGAIAAVCAAVSAACYSAKRQPYYAAVLILNSTSAVYFFVKLHLA